MGPGRCSKGRAVAEVPPGSSMKGFGMLGKINNFLLGSNFLIN